MAHSLVLLFLLAACDTFVQQEHCEGTCIADPIPHCIREHDCRYGIDCPAGLDCFPPILGQVACSIPGVDDQRACRWSMPSLDTLALIAGFETRTMSAAVVGGNSPRIEWTAPTNAAFVKCAVFTCNPTVLPRDIRNDADLSPNGQPLLHIANAQACMLDILAPTDSARTSLPLRPVGAGFAPICTPERSYREHVIDFVAAACWAYDHNDIIAASELVPVDLDIARTLLTMPLPTTCGTGVCYEPAQNFFGLCVDGECRPRCADAVDCEFATRAINGIAGASADLCLWECRSVEASSVGVCVPRWPNRSRRLP